MLAALCVFSFIGGCLLLGIFYWAFKEIEQYLDGLEELD